MKTFTLIPVDGRKSFGGKCHVNEYTTDDGVTYSDLISYDIRVADYNYNTNEIRIFGRYSVTTARHINAFLELYGFGSMTKKEMITFNP